MDAAWVGVIGALGGVFVGAIAEAVRSNIAFKREKRWAVIEEQRRRLEMIYEALEQVGDSYGRSTAPVLLQLGTGHVPTQQDVPPKIPWAHLRMLVNLYRPSLLPFLAKVEIAGPQLGEAMGLAVMRASGQASRDRELGDRIMTRFNVLTQAIAEMREAIVSASREIDLKAAKLVGR